MKPSTMVIKRGGPWFHHSPRLYGSGQVAPPLWASVSSSDKRRSNCFDKQGHASVRLAGRQDLLQVPDLERLREPAPNLLRTHEADTVITSIFQDRKLRPRAGVRALEPSTWRHGGSCSFHLTGPTSP